MAYGYKRKRRYTRRRPTYRRRRTYRRASKFAPRTKGASRVPRALAALAERVRRDPGFASALTSKRYDHSPLGPFPGLHPFPDPPGRSSWDLIRSGLSQSRLGRKGVKFWNKAVSFHKDPLGSTEKFLQSLLWRVAMGDFSSWGASPDSSPSFPGGFPSTDASHGEL